MVDEIEHNNNRYFALIPFFEEDKNLDDSGLDEQIVILKSSMVDGEEMMVDEIEHNNNRYFALIPFFEEDKNLDDSGLDEQIVILKSSMVDGEEMMVTIESQEEYEEVGQLFFSRFQDIMEEMGEEFTE